MLKGHRGWVEESKRRGGEKKKKKAGVGAGRGVEKGEEGLSSNGWIC